MRQKKIVRRWLLSQGNLDIDKQSIGPFIHFATLKPLFGDDMKLPQSTSPEIILFATFHRLPKRQIHGNILSKKFYSFFLLFRVSGSHALRKLCAHIPLLNLFVVGIVRLSIFFSTLFFPCEEIEN